MQMQHNYNADADISDDSCEYASTPGCMDESACNFNSDAQIDDGSVIIQQLTMTVKAIVLQQCSSRWWILSN